MVEKVERIERTFECYLCDFDYGLLSLYVDGLKIVIVSKIKTGHIINDKKVKSVEKILSKFKKAGIHRVARVSYNSVIIGRRRFEVFHSAILELLDEQGYEIKN